jgi:hypothetical protein
MFSLIKRVAGGVPIVPTLALLASAGVAAYALRVGSSSSDTPIGPAPTPTPAAYYPLGPPIVFNSIVDPSGTQYLPVESDIPEPYTVSNPVTVAMAIGAGLRFQKEGEPPAQNYGHLHVFIDAGTPLPLEPVDVDATHIDLADGSHVAQLPELDPGEHQVTAVWTDSNNVTGYPVAAATIHLDISPPGS